MGSAKASAQQQKHGQQCLVVGMIVATGCLVLLLLQHPRSQCKHMPLRHHQGSAGLTAPDWPMHLPAWFNDSRQAGAPIFSPPFLGLTEETVGEWTSQYGEDKFAFQHFFYGIKGGSYLEMGGLDGKKFSNTLWFHRHLSWRGVLIEGDPTSFPQLRNNRPFDITVHAAVCKERTQVHYVVSSEHAVSGIVEFMSDTLKYAWHEQHANGTTIEVACLPLKDILSHYAIRHIDFFSLDVEGGELTVLESIDFSCISFNVILVEQDGSNEAKDETVRQLLARNGYTKAAREGRNEWFLRQGWSPSTNATLQAAAAL